MTNYRAIAAKMNLTDMALVHGDHVGAKDGDILAATPMTGLLPSTTNHSACAAFTAGSLATGL